VGKYKPKYFPFSAGIPWKVESGKYIVPEIDSGTWHKVTQGRDIIITAFGGLFESFFSLSVAEALNIFDPTHKLYWLGNPEYEFFVRAQNLCKVSNINLTPDVLKSYPVPLFFDQDENAYINTLNNFLVRTSYWGKYPQKVDAPVVEQIFSNAMIPWRDYTPKLRRVGTEFYDELVKTSRITYKSRVVTIIQSPTNDDVLGWNVHNIKEFAQLATSKGLKVVLFTPNTSVFHGTKMKVFEYDIRKVVQTLQKSWMVLSTSNDWLLVALMISDAKMISRHIDGPYGLFKNAEVLKVQNDIFTDREWVSPIDAFTICEGLL